MLGSGQIIADDVITYVDDVEAVVGVDVEADVGVDVGADVNADDDIKMPKIGLPVESNSLR